MTTTTTPYNDHASRVSLAPVQGCPNLHMSFRPRRHPTTAFITPFPRISSSNSSSRRRIMLPLKIWLPIVLSLVVLLAFQNIRAIIFLVSTTGNDENGAASDTMRWFQLDDWLHGLPLQLSSLPSSASSFSTKAKKKITVAYAVSVTKCVIGDPVRSTLDRAAVLHQSIKLAHGTARDHGGSIPTDPPPKQPHSKYDFHIHAFLHYNASECAPMFRQLGYHVQVKDTPVHKEEMTENLAGVQHNSCCGDKEWSKLYAYVLTEYPVVVHLDLDTVVLKVMEDVFDLMTDTPSTPTTTTATTGLRSSSGGGGGGGDGYNRSKFLEGPSRSHAQWIHQPDYNNINVSSVNVEEFPSQVDFVFTRDYNMVNPPNKKVHQIGVQGGFLVVRPNATEFDRMVALVKQGADFEPRAGWGGPKLAYGGYFGAGTIQGFASYYYSEVARNRSVEVNRCYYNTMVDSPYHVRKDWNRTLCRTLEPDGTCEDCRLTPLENIFTAHFTVCGKPEWCRLSHEVPLCVQLFSEWHRIRLTLEEEWMDKYGRDSDNEKVVTPYDPMLAPVRYNSTLANEQKLAKARGHCRVRGGYIPLKLPNVTEQVM